MFASCQISLRCGKEGNHASTKKAHSWRSEGMDLTRSRVDNQSSTLQLFRLFSAVVRRLVRRTYSHWITFLFHRTSNDANLGYRGIAMPPGRIQIYGGDFQKFAELWCNGYVSVYYPDHRPGLAHMHCACSVTFPNC